MHCNLIGERNGVGLTQDIDLLTTYLKSRGHTVDYCHWDSVSKPADVNFHVEFLEAKNLTTADKHVGIFNLEWFREGMIPYLSNMTQVWAKSSIAHEWLMEHGANVTYTGFLSRDLYDPSVPRLQSVVHVAGQSQFKNTAAVLEVYRRWGAKLPPLTIVSNAPLDVVARNVTQRGLLETSEFIKVMNSATIHLCPSQVEGWGHYIAEALACKGIVITTDASPMHDHVLPGFGVLLPAKATLARVSPGFVKVDLHSVTPESIRDALLAMAAIDDAERWRMQTEARVWWRVRQASFMTKADELLAKLAG